MVFVYFSAKTYNNCSCFVNKLSEMHSSKSVELEIPLSSRACNMQYVLRNCKLMPSTLLNRVQIEEKHACYLLDYKEIRRHGLANKQKKLWKFKIGYKKWKVSLPRCRKLLAWINTLQYPNVFSNWN